MILASTFFVLAIVAAPRSFGEDPDPNGGNPPPGTLLPYNCGVCNGNGACVNGAFAACGTISCLTAGKFRCDIECDCTGNPNPAVPGQFLCNCIRKP